MSAIDDKYASLGGAGGVLGPSIGPETTAPDGVGRFRHFQLGSIYWTPQTGAHEVHGAIHGLWSSLGWELSVLGYPVTDEMPTPDGVGRFNNTSYEIFDPSTGILGPAVHAAPLANCGPWITYPFVFVLPTRKLVVHGGTHTVFLDLTTFTFDGTELEAVPRPSRNGRTSSLGWSQAAGRMQRRPLLPGSPPRRPTPPHRRASRSHTGCATSVTCG